MATVTNYNKFGLNNTNIFLEVRSPKWDPIKLKSRSWQVYFFSGGSGKESIFMPFPASNGHPHPLTHCPLFLTSQAAMWHLSDYSYVVTHSPSMFKDPVISLTPIR